MSFWNEGNFKCKLNTYEENHYHHRVKNFPRTPFYKMNDGLPPPMPRSPYSPDSRVHPSTCTRCAFFFGFCDQIFHLLIINRGRILVVNRNLPAFLFIIGIDFFFLKKIIDQIFFEKQNRLSTSLKRFDNRERTIIWIDR